MQVSNKKLNKTIQEEINKMLYQLMVDSQDQREVKMMLNDLLTEAEMTAIIKRLAIAVYLDKGRSYENIKNNLKVSSATIASVAESMGNPGIQMAIQKIKAEEWAEEWSQKISGTMRRFLPKR